MLVNKPREISLNQLLHLGLQSSTQHSLKAIILHWTSGRYEQADNSYHLNIDGKGSILQTCYKLHELKAHTKNRNEDTIGIALCCGYQASYKDLGHIYYGPCPPTMAQVEQAAKAIAVLCMTLGWIVSYNTVKTHFELALENGYGPGSGEPEKRWDLAKVPKTANPTNFDLGGLIFRSRALFYYNQLLEKRRAKEAHAPVPAESFEQIPLLN